VDDSADDTAYKEAALNALNSALFALPRKIVITSRADEARPQSVHLIDWNLKPAFGETTFRFTPLKGASKVEIVPRKAR